MTSMSLRGYTLIAHRLRTKEAECDLVMENDSEIAFIEVKYRKYASCSLDSWKRLQRSKLRKAICAWPTTTKQIAVYYACCWRWGIRFIHTDWRDFA